MSNVNVLFGLLVFWMLLFLIFGSMAIGKCGGEFDKFQSTIPDENFDLFKFLGNMIGSILNPCSGLWWISALVLFPIGAGILYLASPFHQ